MKAYASLPGIIYHRNSIFGAVSGNSVIFRRMYDRTHVFMTNRVTFASDRIAIQAHHLIQRDLIERNEKPI